MISLLKPFLKPFITASKCDSHSCGTLALEGETIGSKSGSCEIVKHLPTVRRVRHTRISCCLDSPILSHTLITSLMTLGQPLISISALISGLASGDPLKFLV